MAENSSSIRNHFLTSILPYQQVKQEQHFLKTKQFYKPEQFIWNNPFRTSKRIYPYYHQANDQYQTKIKPVIQKLQEQDRINLEQQRIKKLTNLRMQTRQRFFQRQKTRQQLQAKSNSRKRKSSTVQMKTIRQQKIPILKNNLFRVHSNTNRITQNIQLSFTQAVNNYDSNLSNIKKLVSQQISQNHRKIRFQFQKRKENNNNLQGSNKLKARKSVGVLKNNNFFDQ